jgi:hypothetical protein
MRRRSPDAGAAPQRDPVGMTLMSFPIATVLAREAVRRQFAVKVRAR